MVTEQSLCYSAGVPRPRVHDPDRILDAAESLAVRSGPGAVTTRAVAAAAGVSNGAIYHEFGSRSGLLGRTWLRAARRFLSAQSDLVTAVLDAGADGVAAVVAAADAPAAFAEQFGTSARLLLGVQRDQLIDGDTPPEVASALAALDRDLVGLMIRLADSLWNRKDAAAVDTITTCIVDLPTAILLSRNRLDQPAARAQLTAAVRAVLAVGPAEQGGNT